MFTGAFTKAGDTLFTFVFCFSHPHRLHVRSLQHLTQHPHLLSLALLEGGSLLIILFINKRTRSTVFISLRSATTCWKNPSPSAMPSNNLPGEPSPPSSRSTSSQPPSSPEWTSSSASPTPTTSRQVDYCLRHSSSWYSESEHDPSRQAPELLAGTHRTAPDGGSVSPEDLSLNNVRWVCHPVSREDRQQHEIEHVVAHLDATAAERPESVNSIAFGSSELPIWNCHFQRLRSCLAGLGWDVRDGRNVMTIMRQLLDGHMVGPVRPPGGRSVWWLDWYRALVLRRESVRVDGGEIDRGTELEVDWRILADVTARQASRLSASIATISNEQRR